MDSFIQTMKQCDPRLNQLFEGSPSFSPNDFQWKEISRVVGTIFNSFHNTPGTPKVTPNFRTEDNPISIRKKVYHQHFIINYEINDEVVAVLSLGRWEKEGGRDEQDTAGVFCVGEKQGLFQSEPGETWIHAVKRFVEMLQWIIIRRKI